MPVHLTRNEVEKCIMGRITRNKDLHQANFTLKQFGTYERAEAAGRKWVKAKLAELPDQLPVKDRMTKRNSSGVVGVRLANATRTKNGNVYPDWRWVAFWSSCPNSGGIGWSVKKYGDDRAFACAYIARKAESIDREEIESQFLRLQNSTQFKQVLKLKLMGPP